MQFDKDMNSNQAELFLEVRDFIILQIEKQGLHVKEKFSENITSYFSEEYQSGFCYLITKDDYVHIGWFRGAKFYDKIDLLFGKGKTIRGQKVTVLDEIQKEAISFYIKQTEILLIENDEIQKTKQLLKGK